MADEIINDIINMSKIPDTIKEIQPYEGDPKTLHQWINQVETVLQFYAPLQQHPIFQLWVRSIRSKIRGDANNAINAKNVPLTWDNMKATLVEFFGDARDLCSIVQNIPHMKQKGKSITDFYKEMSEMASSAMQKINLDERFGDLGPIEAAGIVIQDLVKNAYIDGLDEEFSRYVRTYKPQSLMDAFKAANELEQANQRKKLLAPIQNYPQRNLPRNAYRAPQNMQRGFQNNAIQYRNPQNSFTQGRNPQNNFAYNRTPQMANQARQPGRNPQYQQLNADQSMRSRAVPMSGISYNSNHAHNIEATRCYDEASNYTDNGEYSENNVQEMGTEQENEELNFLLATLGTGND